MKLLQTKEYLLLIDEKNRGIEYGEVGVNMRHSKLEVETRNMGGYGSDKYYWGHKKCIAYYPLNSEANGLNLPLLPNPFEELDVEKSAYTKYPVSPQKRKVFIGGYKAATKQFSLEDIAKAFNAGQRYEFSAEQGDGLAPDVEEYIQSLSTQQLPKQFIPEYEKEIIGQVSGTVYVDKELKTTTNQEGKEVLCGTYKY